MGDGGQSPCDGGWGMLHRFAMHGQSPPTPIPQAKRCNTPIPHPHPPSPAVLRCCGVASQSDARATPPKQSDARAKPPKRSDARVAVLRCCIAKRCTGKAPQAKRCNKQPNLSKAIYLAENTTPKNKRILSSNLGISESII